MKNQTLLILLAVGAAGAAFFYFNSKKATPVAQNSTGQPVTPGNTNITLGSGTGGVDATAARIKAIGALTSSIPTLLQGVYGLLPSGGANVGTTTSGGGGTIYV